MAQGARRPRTIDGEPAQEAVLLPRNAETEWDPDLEAAFEQLKEDFRSANSEGTLWVYRLPVDERGDLIANAKQVYLFSAPVQRYSTEEIFDKIQREFMDGLKLTCVRIAATKKGERGMRFNQIAMLEAAHRDPEPQPGPPGSNVSDLVRAIVESNERTAAMMRDALKPQPQITGPPPNKIGELRELAEIVFLLNGKQQAAPAPVVMPPGPPPGSLLDQLKGLRELRRVVGEFAGDGGGGGSAADDGDGPLSLLRHLSPWAQVFANLTTQGGARRRVPPGRQPGPAPGAQPTVPPAPVVPPPAPAPRSAFDIPTPPPAAQPTAPPAQPQEDPMIAEMRNQLAALTESAKQNGDPAQVAGAMLGMLPEGSPEEAQLLNFLSAPSWWQQCCALYPPAMDYAPWFQILRDTILSAFEDGDPTVVASQ